MRLRLSDVAPSAVLAEHYRVQAELCHQMARMTVSPFKEGWLELAAEWTNLARETEAKPHFSMAADQLVPQQYYDRYQSGASASLDPAPSACRMFAQKRT